MIHCWITYHQKLLD